MSNPPYLKDNSECKKKAKKTTMCRLSGHGGQKETYPMKICFKVMIASIFHVLKHDVANIKRSSIRSCNNGYICCIYLKFYIVN